MSQGLERLLLSQLVSPCEQCVRLWTFLARSGPPLLSSTACAQALGHRNRYQLARWLGKHGYPPFRQVADWARVINWLLESQRTSTSLARQAWAVGKEPSVCYRTTRRLCGNNWFDVRREGLDPWIHRFREHFRDLPACRSYSASTSTLHSAHIAHKEWATITT
jgi:hypothetical protein